MERSPNTKQGYGRAAVMVSCQQPHGIKHSYDQMICLLS